MSNEYRDWLVDQNDDLKAAVKRLKSALSKIAEADDDANIGVLREIARSALVIEDNTE